MWEEGVTRGLEAGWYADSSLWPQSLGDQERLGRAGRGVVLQPQPYASGFHRTIPSVHCSRLVASGPSQLQ